MALKTGFSQTVLKQRFTAVELMQVLAYKRIEHKTRSKDDARFQLLTYHCATAPLIAQNGSKAASHLKPENFILDWDNASKRAKSQTPAEMWAAAEATAALYNRKS